MWGFLLGVNLKNIRNIAIIAHVDHGKTTLVDELLKQSKIFRKNQVVQDCFLDSNDLERERGITILSKNISIPYKNFKINLIDTPGHADFGGEVERVLKMADGVLLLVDSFEGPMPQTRFVLEKALSLHLKPIVVINKIDRPDNRPMEVLDEIYDLFIDLDATEEQLDFKFVYASGRNGWAVKKLTDERIDLTPLLERIINNIPEPEILEGDSQMQVASIDYNDYVGRIGIGRVFRGTLKRSEPLNIIKRDGSVLKVNIKQLFTFEGLGRVEVDEVQNGDICAIVGIENIDIGDTIAGGENPEPMPIIAIDEPTMSLNFTVNTSPFYGKEGKYVTSRHLRDRLYKELEQNVALHVEETGSPDTYKVSGRGILHLSILMENMRREGYELEVGKPEVIIKEIDGVKCEPVEELTVEIDAEYTGAVVEELGKRRAQMKDSVTNEKNVTKMIFEITTRNLLGFRTEILTKTRGNGLFASRFMGYFPISAVVSKIRNGVLIASESGTATAYALDSIQQRGITFIVPGQSVYEGQIIGINKKQEDMEMNIAKGKKLTNFRANADFGVQLTPPTILSLEQCLDFLEDDELLEVTPKSLRLRKRVLNKQERNKASRR